MELGPRDRLSQAFMKELEKGRTIETPSTATWCTSTCGILGRRRINTKIPFVRELCLKYQNLDPVKDLIPVRPVVHYMMGGVHTDINGATPLPGLYAAGEVACVSINGANRLGSNSLPELLVFGARAGRAAAEYASRGRDVSAERAGPGEETRSIGSRTISCNTDGRERIADLRDAMQKTMEQSAGIYRSGASLERGVEQLRALQERYADISVEDRSRTFNTERVAALELAFMLDVADAIVDSALAARGIARRSPAHGFPAARRSSASSRIH